MKKISKYTTLVGLVALGAVAPVAFGLTENNAYIESYRGRTDIPVPVKVVSPDVDANQIGAKAEVEFLVDSSGRPQKIEILSATDRDFGESVCRAVEQWKFSPARPKGTAVPMRVMLPVVVTPTG